MTDPRPDAAPSPSGATAEPEDHAPAARGDDAPDSRAAPSPPADDALAPAIAAMDRGDLREARRLATALVARGDEVPPSVRARAATLLGQLAPDRTVVAVMAFTGLLGVLLALLYFAARLP